VKKIVIFSILCLVLVSIFTGCLPNNIINNKCPYLQIIDTNVLTRNIYGLIEKRFYVITQNVSDKVITAYKVRIKGYDDFGDPKTIDFRDTFIGISQSLWLEPGENSSGNRYWSSVYANAVTNIKAEIIRVLFEDGTTWEE